MNVLRLSIAPDGVHGSMVLLGSNTVLAEGSDAVCCRAARVLMLKLGYDPATTFLEFYRGDALALRGLLGNFAFQTVSVSEEGRPAFVPYRPKSPGTGVLGGRERSPRSETTPNPEEGK